MDVHELHKGYCGWLYRFLFSPYIQNVRLLISSELWIWCFAASFWGFGNILLTIIIGFHFLSLARPFTPFACWTSILCDLCHLLCNVIVRARKYQLSSTLNSSFISMTTANKQQILFSLLFFCSMFSFVSLFCSVFPFHSILLHIFFFFFLKLIVVSQKQPVHNIVPTKNIFPERQRVTSQTNLNEMRYIHQCSKNIRCMHFYCAKSKK